MPLPRNSNLYSKDEKNYLNPQNYLDEMLIQLGEMMNTCFEEFYFSRLKADSNCLKTAGISSILDVPIERRYQVDSFGAPKA